ncbi:hypothetical protein WICPIJ_006101 [Wickerhamomyces pijperi]|uniref:Ubiquitin-like protease family profile domain-containing protein n=1 Tax=Wickerhamomyces pijperi TaxID=599730 RepID=A0A9P8Q4X0_WICPI|nr:hypothetical protein WICPIJ_006101 [Wickerhamomyces pijperi]
MPKMHTYRRTVSSQTGVNSTPSNDKTKINTSANTVQSTFRQQFGTPRIPSGNGHPFGNGSKAATPSSTLKRKPKTSMGYGSISTATTTSKTPAKRIIIPNHSIISTHKSTSSLKRKSPAYQTNSNNNSSINAFRPQPDWTRSSDKMKDSTTQESMSFAQTLESYASGLFSRTLGMLTDRTNPPAETSTIDPGLNRSASASSSSSEHGCAKAFSSSPSNSADSNDSKVSLASITPTTPLKKLRPSTSTKTILSSATKLPSPSKAKYTPQDLSFMNPSVEDLGLESIINANSPEKKKKKIKPDAATNNSSSSTSPTKNVDYGKQFVKRAIHNRVRTLTQSRNSSMISTNGNDTTFITAESPSNKSFFHDLLTGSDISSPKPKSTAPPPSSRHGTPMSTRRGSMASLSTTVKKSNGDQSVSKSRHTSELSGAVSEAIEFFTTPRSRLLQLQLNRQNSTSANTKSTPNSTNDPDISIISVRKLPKPSSESKLTLRFNESRTYFQNQYAKLERELQQLKENEKINLLVKKQRSEALKPQRSKLLREVTKEEESRINQLWYNGGAGSRLLLSQYQIDLTLDDLRTLTDGSWLNDNVIEMYLKTLDTESVFAYTPFFFTKLESDGYKGVAKWLKRNKREIHKLDRIIVPINIARMHWVLGVIDLKGKKIYYLDSLCTRKSQHGERALQLMKTYVAEQFKREGKTVDIATFKLEHVLDCPQQGNGYDCGIFTLMNSLHFAKLDPVELNYQSTDSKMFRRIVANELLKLGGL